MYNLRENYKETLISCIIFICHQSYYCFWMNFLRQVCTVEGNGEQGSLKYIIQEKMKGVVWLTLEVELPMK